MVVHKGNKKYKFQYNNIYSSATICISVRKYTFQYNDIYSSTDSIPVQKL